MKRLALQLALTVILLILPAALAGAGTIGPTELLGTTGYVGGGAVGDCPGFLAVGPGQSSNPAGYWEIDPFAWWRCRRWVLFDFALLDMQRAVSSVDDSDSFGSGFSWAAYNAPSYFGVDEGADLGDPDGFGIDEDPTLGDGFGAGESPVPEPGAVSLLAVGALGLLHRRAGVRSMAPAQQVGQASRLSRLRRRSGGRSNTPP